MIAARTHRPGSLPKARPPRRRSDRRGRRRQAPWLEQLPDRTLLSAPTRLDLAARSERTPMNGAERRAFFCRYALGLTLLVLVYLLITVMRSIRADFAPEIWAGLGATGG